MVNAILNLSFIVLILFVCSFFIRLSFVINRQYWIKTKTLFLSVLLLPVITFVITKVISGNLALSLGMVGALSIVRFRNPVKSPLELVLYFTLITLGISASVDIKWTILLTSVVVFVNLATAIYDTFLSDKFNLPKFLYSFSEGNPLSTLELTIDQDLEFLNNSNHFNSRTFHENIYVYRFASSNIEDLKSIIEKLKKDKIDLLNYSLQKY